MAACVTVGIGMWGLPVLVSIVVTGRRDDGTDLPDLRGDHYQGNDDTCSRAFAIPNNRS
jgi:hypothetical protein